MHQRTVAVTFTMVCACGLVSCQEPTMERQISTVLREWKNERLVTIEIEKAPFSKTIKLFEMKTGVRFDGNSKEPIVSLKLQDTPFWKSVAELSNASRTSFSIESAGTSFRGEGPRIVFNSHYAPCDHYQLIGPFHLGVYHRGSDQEPLVLLQASSLDAEGQVSGKGIRKAFLKTGGRTITLQQADLASDEISKGHWAIPRQLVQEAGDLLGEMECEV